MVRSPVAVTSTTAPEVAASPSSIGAVSMNVAVGNCDVSRASCTRSSRRLSLVVIDVMSASMLAAVTVVPSTVTVPETAGVRPTAVVEPMPVSSSVDAEADERARRVLEAERRRCSCRRTRCRRWSTSRRPRRCRRSRRRRPRSRRSRRVAVATDVDGLGRRLQVDCGWGVVAEEPPDPRTACRQHEDGGDDGGEQEAATTAAARRRDSVLGGRSWRSWTTTVDHRPVSLPRTDGEQGTEAPAGSQRTPSEQPRDWRRAWSPPVDRRRRGEPALDARRRLAPPRFRGLRRRRRPRRPSTPSASWRPTSCCST